MTPFAFLIHPLTAKDAARKYPMLAKMPDRWIEAYMRFRKPVLVSEITGIRSVTGEETKGWFIGLPMTPSMMMNMPLEFTYQRIVQCAELAESLGAKLLGLGAFSSVVGDGGVTIAQRSKIAITTGNSYTVATAIEAALKAAEQVGIETARATLAVVGGTGSIGKTCAVSLAPFFSRTLILGRDLAKAQALADELPRGEAVSTPEHLRQADVMITVSSAAKEIVFPEHLKRGAVIVDVARPRDVSVRVAQERPDVLVIEGGVVAVPGDPDFHFNFGFPPKTAYACMSETIMLALDNTPIPLTLGKDVSVEQVEHTQRLAQKHGFHLAGFRSFERAVDADAIQRARAARESAVHA